MNQVWVVNSDEWLEWLEQWVEMNENCAMIWIMCQLKISIQSWVYLTWRTAEEVFRMEVSYPRQSEKRNYVRLYSVFFLPQQYLAKPPLAWWSSIMPTVCVRWRNSVACTIECKIRKCKVQSSPRERLTFWMQMPVSKTWGCSCLQSPGRVQESKVQDLVRKLNNRYSDKSSIGVDQRLNSSAWEGAMPQSYHLI